MRILFDQGTPAPLRYQLLGHQVVLAYEQGWSTLENGELLNAAESAGFEVFVTTDKNLRYKQNLSQRKNCFDRAVCTKLATRTTNRGRDIARDREDQTQRLFRN